MSCQRIWSLAQIVCRSDRSVQTFMLHAGTPAGGAQRQAPHTPFVTFVSWPMQVRQRDGELAVLMGMAPPKLPPPLPRGSPAVPSQHLPARTSSFQEPSSTTVLTEGSRSTADADVAVSRASSPVKLGEAASLDSSPSKLAGRRHGLILACACMLTACTRWSHWGPDFQVVAVAPHGLLWLVGVLAVQLAWAAGRGRQQGMHDSKSGMRAIQV